MRVLNEKIVREKFPDFSVSILEHLKPEIEVVSGSKMNLEFYGIGEVGFLIGLKLIGVVLIWSDKDYLGSVSFPAYLVKFVQQ